MRKLNLFFWRVPLFFAMPQIVFTKDEVVGENVSRATIPAETARGRSAFYLRSLRSSPRSLDRVIG